ncbi:branched-chain amino acid ABC transporter permease [Thioclava sp.]|uniref:branched-chain amino acid ABC transporter permease n=1 Tax=Thioclava sp. TaxID=1933450 RepID=UPI003AA8561A
MARLGIGGWSVRLIVLGIGIALLFAPFLFPGVRAIEVAARICVFIVLVASYDLLIGYTGIVSFAHTMFFGLGAYGVGIALAQHDASWSALILGGAAGVLAALVLAVLIALLSLRVKAIFFAMVTLAVASVALVLASQLSKLTGGEDGLTYSAPDLFSPATALFHDASGRTARLFGVRMDGKIAAYYFIFGGSLVFYLILLRVTVSPLGTVLKAIRENEARAEALGYRVVAYRTFVFGFTAVMAALAGALYATWLQYTGPDTTLSFEIMVDILLMVVIGGMGTMWGAVIGAAALVMAQYYLRDLMQAASDALIGLPILPNLLNPDRWLLWLGIVFILLVYFFPAGIAGTLAGRETRK